MDTIQNAGKYVKETIQGATSEASKETNKNVAKDSNAPLSSRANAAVDALGDKKDEKKHDFAAEGHKQQATH
ncbi:Glucose-repressible protein [Coniochaeta pulveracea]|uniref:Glucose-repressible protein n=1 Tax=Coniochaeta pulveracea TaxID=177199 RepID=A0A420Y678_9PEZI|nr:Glucose-repressible protein [Coniochaeta pulveracea]